jgi:hypothetical protein
VIEVGRDKRGINGERMRGNRGIEILDTAIEVRRAR